MGYRSILAKVSTHSRPKAAGSAQVWGKPNLLLFQHTAARRRLGYKQAAAAGGNVFQHTAARRRLVRSGRTVSRYAVFQHTAARRRLDPYRLHLINRRSFNTQPPEGGWPPTLPQQSKFQVSTHSRPKAAGYWPGQTNISNSSFNTQPPEGGWERQRTNP